MSITPPPPQINLEQRWVFEQFPQDFKGYAIDVGAADGRELSNTIDLELAGWTVLCVEANPEYASRLQQTRSHWLIVAVDDTNRISHPMEINTAAPMSSSQLRRNSNWNQWPADTSMKSICVPTMTLDTILAWSGFPRLDFLSVDVEGTEIDVLNGFDLERWKPKAMILESWTDPSNYHELLTPRYDRVQRIEFNDLYLRRETDEAITTSIGDAKEANVSG